MTQFAIQGDLFWGLVPGDKDLNSEIIRYIQFFQVHMWRGKGNPGNVNLKLFYAIFVSYPGRKSPYTVKARKIYLEHGLSLQYC